jgi:hypothetical protein
LHKVFTATAFARLIRDSQTLAVRSAIADILPFQARHLHRFAAPALARITFATLTGAFRPAATENAGALLDGQQMHRNQRRPAIALALFAGNEIAFAVIFTVTDVISLALFRSHNQSNRYNQKHYTHDSNGRFFHIYSLF